MKTSLQSLYRFLPVQLLLLHFRKYQLLLVFWVILFATIYKQFAVNFGAVSLFLSPEYLGKTNIISFFLLGCATATFSMSWHITTFIIHSKRLPFLGATRHAFLKYCINNAALPLIYLFVFGVQSVIYLHENEALRTSGALLLLAGFYAGYVFILILSFSYFFRVDRDILKAVLSRIANPSLIRNIIPYDTLDRELDLVRADSYIASLFRIKKIKAPYQYNQRLVSVVLRRHHRNAMFAVSIALLTLLILGIFMDNPILRIPAGAGFLLLFTVMMAAMGAFKYFLRSWEILGWLTVIGIISVLTHFKVFDLRSIAYGMNYQTVEKPKYDYPSIRALFNDSLYERDKSKETERLTNWLENRKRDGSFDSKPPLVIISVSGGGSRSAYWTFRCLQVADSMTQGRLFGNTVLISGASGGMMGAAYWRSLQAGYIDGMVNNRYDSIYQENIGKDLLNAIIFSLAAVDFISPFNKITVAGRRYSKDRGYAFDKQLIANTDDLLDVTLDHFKAAESKGASPMLIINGTIINDGRKLLISSQPVSYLTRSENSLNKAEPVIDGIDFAQFFHRQDPLKLKLTTAIRMSATFPLVLPVVKLPSQPTMNIMDAGLRDNYGTENISRYLHTFREWIREHTGEVIFLQIRDTRQAEPSKMEDQRSMASMILDPVFAIQKKWAAFQTFNQTLLQDYLQDEFSANRFRKIVLQYIPTHKEKSVALNFHLTTKEKTDLLQSIYNADNQKALLELKSVLFPSPNIKAEQQNRKNELSHQ